MGCVLLFDQRVCMVASHKCALRSNTSRRSVPQARKRSGKRSYKESLQRSGANIVPTRSAQVRPFSNAHFTSCTTPAPDWIRSNSPFQPLTKLSLVCSAYDRKKYTWKLLYSHMMGYDVDFGHKQAADLIPSNNYDEKQVGYQALTILLNEV